MINARPYTLWQNHACSPKQLVSLSWFIQYLCTQVHLFNYFWKNKNDKVKRQVIYQPLSEGGLNFLNFRIMVQSLRLAWLGNSLIN